MPWVDMKSPVCHPGVGTTTVFTGTRTSPSFSSEGQLSTNVPVRCPKRKALDVLDEAPTSKIYLCADQFANLKISAGEKQNFGLPADDGGNTGVQFYTGVKTSKSKCDIEGWQRFRDIENRLDVEVEEDIDLNMGKVRGSKEGPCLKVAEGVLGPAVVNSQILPRRVMEDITKPCMQVVLWKSPGEIIREIAQEEVTKTPSSFSTTITTNVTSINRTTATNRMDTSERYPLSSRDNIMDTTLGAPTLDPISHFQPAPSSSFSSANFLTPPLLPNMVQIPASTHGNISHAAANSTNNGLVDLDMFDSLDDDMQL
uniref:Uncharacterized protein n=1 Tax=Arion vulgaris TaxID=1028688 RepID=A0A0B6YFM4_9EUPU